MTTRIWACRALLRHYEQQPSGVWTPPCCGLENIETEKRLAWVYTALPQLSRLFFDNKLRLSDSHTGPANIRFNWSDDPDLNGFGYVRVSRRHGDIPITIKIDRKILETEFWETNVIVVLLHQMVHAYFVVECVHRDAYDSRDYGYETEHDIPFCVLLYKISQNFKTIIPLGHLLYSEPYIVESECPSHDSWYEDNGTGFCYWKSVDQHGVPPEVLEDCARLICEGRDLPETLAQFDYLPAAAEFTNPRRPRLNANFATSTQIAQTETTDEQDHGHDEDDDHENSAGGSHEGRGDDVEGCDGRYHGHKGRDRGNHSGRGDCRGGSDNGNGDCSHGGPSLTPSTTQAGVSRTETSLSSATRARQERESYVNRRQGKRPCTRPHDEDSNGPSEHWQAPYPKDDEWDRRAHPIPEVEDTGRSQHTGQDFKPRPTRRKSRTRQRQINRPGSSLPSSFYEHTPEPPLSTVPEHSQEPVWGPGSHQKSSEEPVSSSPCSRKQREKAPEPSAPVTSEESYDSTENRTPSRQPWQAGWSDSLDALPSLNPPSSKSSWHKGHSHKGAGKAPDQSDKSHDPVRNKPPTSESSQQSRQGGYSDFPDPAPLPVPPSPEPRRGHSSKRHQRSSDTFFPFEEEEAKRHATPDQPQPERRHSRSSRSKSGNRRSQSRRYRNTPECFRSYPPVLDLTPDELRHLTPSQQRRYAEEKKSSRRRRLTSYFRPRSADASKGTSKHRYSGSLFGFRRRSSPPGPVWEPSWTAEPERNRSQSRGRRRQRGSHRGMRRWSRHRRRVHDQEEEQIDADDGNGHTSHRHQRRSLSRHSHRRSNSRCSYHRRHAISEARGRQASAAEENGERWSDSDSQSNFSRPTEVNGKKADGGKGWGFFRRWRAERRRKRAFKKQLNKCEVCAARRRNDRILPRLVNATTEAIIYG